VGPLLHVKWFVDASRYPAHLDGEALARTALALAVGGAAVAVSAVLDRLWQRHRQPVPLPVDAAGRLFAWLPLILGLHLAALLITSGVQRQLFAPNLQMPRTFWAGVLALGEIVVALSLVYGALTRLAAVAIGGLFAAGLVIFGPLDLLDHLHLLGIACFLFVFGRGPYSLDTVFGLPRPPLERLVLWSVPVLRVLTGAAIAWTGLTEKLWNLPLAEAFLRARPFNFMPALGFAGFSDRDFAVAAGIVEVTVGILLASGLLTRLVILVAWLPFNLTLPFLGWAELVGHLPIYGVMAVLLALGSGRAVRAVLRELVRAAA
jgi:uncharacterized membrane protein YphA (DoxX/SURF4 family)